MSMDKKDTQPDTPIGAAIIVDGKVVAWFETMDDAAREWCSSNYFGRWIAWRAHMPHIITLSEEERVEVERRGKELSSKIRVV